ncbi:MAG: hypothetical protein ABI718_14150 [Acidobacteriota bacterium]
MARYVQKITIGGRERWIGWEIDGIGTEISGLFLVDDLPPEELRAKGVKSFAPMSFDDFIGLGAINNRSEEKKKIPDDEDMGFRLDALEVMMGRLLGSGFAEIPAHVIPRMLGGVSLDDPRVQTRIRSWQDAGAVEFRGTEDCYVHLLRRIH